QDSQSGPAGIAAAARSLYSRLYANAQKAEFGAAQSRARAPDQRHRSNDLYSWRWAQPAGALHRVNPRRPREGSTWSALSRCARHAGCYRRSQPQAGTLKIRSEATQVRLPGIAEIG